MAAPYVSTKRKTSPVVAADAAAAVVVAAAAVAIAGNSATIQRSLTSGGPKPPLWCLRIKQPKPTVMMFTVGFALSVLGAGTPQEPAIGHA